MVLYFTIDSTNHLESEYSVFGCELSPWSKTTTDRGGAEVRPHWCVGELRWDHSHWHISGHTFWKVQGAILYLLCCLSHIVSIWGLPTISEWVKMMKVLFLTTWLGKNLAYQVKLSRKRTFIISCLQEQLRNLYNSKWLVLTILGTCTKILNRAHNYRYVQLHPYWRASSDGSGCGRHW